MPRTLVLGALSISTLLLTSPATDRPAARKPSIRQVATLHTPRSVHTATTLTSGQVLVVGGMSDGGASLASVELFDPSRNSVEELSSLAETRAGHTATLLPNGRVIVAGGYDGEYLASVEVFDPATRRFRSMGRLLEARSGHTATVLPDGRILFVGGVGRGYSFLRSAEVYDPASGRSEAVGSMRVPRESHTATLLEDGRVLIVGGHNGRREQMQVFATAEVFSPRTGRFEAAGALATARHKHDAIRLADGRVLVVGGADRSDQVYFATTEIYDPRSGAFTEGPLMRNARFKIAGTSALMSDASVLVAGGASSAEILDPRTGVVRGVHGGFPAAYHFAATAVLPDGDVLILGGYDDHGRGTAGVWRFQNVVAQ